MPTAEEMAARFVPHRSLAVRLKDVAGALTMAYRDDEQEVWLVYFPYSTTKAQFMTDAELAECAEGVSN